MSQLDQALEIGKGWGAMPWGAQIATIAGRP